MPSRRINVMELSKSESKMHGKDVNNAKCPVCGKTIYFTLDMTKADWAYKTVNSNGTCKYYCGWSHYRQAERKADKEKRVT